MESRSHGRLEIAHRGKPIREEECVPGQHFQDGLFRKAHLLADFRHIPAPAGRNLELSRPGIAGKKQGARLNARDLQEAVEHEFPGQARLGQPFVHRDEMLEDPALVRLRRCGGMRRSPGLKRFLPNTFGQKVMLHPQIEDAGEAVGHRRGGEAVLVVNEEDPHAFRAMGKPLRDVKGFIRGPDDGDGGAPEFDGVFELFDAAA